MRIKKRYSDAIEAQLPVLPPVPQAPEEDGKWLADITSEFDHTDIDSAISALTNLKQQYPQYILQLRANSNYGGWDSVDIWGLPLNYPELKAQYQLDLAAWHKAKTARNNKRIKLVAQARKQKEVEEATEILTKHGYKLVKE